MLNHEPETVKNVMDGAAAIVGIGAVVQWLPPLAAGLTIIWTLIRIYDWVRAQTKKEPRDDKPD